MEVRTQGHPTDVFRKISVPQGVYLMAGKEILRSCWEKYFSCVGKLIPMRWRSRLSWEKCICCDGYIESNWTQCTFFAYLLPSKYFKQEPIQRRFDFSDVLYFGWPNQPSSGTMRVYIELLLCTYIYIVNGC